MKYAVVHGLLGVLLFIQGAVHSGWAWLLSWLGLCFLALAVAYAYNEPSIFGKRADGRLPLWSWAAFLPLHLYTRFVWHLIRLLSREPVYAEVIPGVYIGRRVLAGELPPGVQTVVDLTAEFQEPAGIRSCTNYRSFPILDATVPEAKRLREFLWNLPEGPLFIHCAQGHGRTALLTLMLIMDRDPTLSLEEARSKLAAARPLARMNREQERFVQQHGARPAFSRMSSSSPSPAPASSGSIHFPRLWDYVIRACPPHDTYSIHGPDHWKRVERNALILASRTGAKIDVVRLFAIFHDCRRVDDGWDPEHGRRGAEYAATLRGQVFDMADDDFALFQYACIWHTEGKHHADPTIGTCWDADRLDLGRAGRIPSPAYMSTEFGKEIAEHGVIHPWVHLAEPYLEREE